MAPRNFKVEHHGDISKGGVSMVGSQMYLYGSANFAQGQDSDDDRYNATVKEFATSNYLDIQAESPRHFEGTCDSTWNTREFQDWYHRGAGILCIIGPPGSGKTVLSRYIVERLQDNEQASDKSKTISFFCPGPGKEHKPTVVSMLQSLIHQCTKLVPSWAKQQIMKKEYAGDNQLVRMSKFRLRRVLNDILSGQNGTGWFCVIDALNNCEETEGEQFLKSFVTEISHKDDRESTANLRLLITSRPCWRLRRWKRILDDLDSSFINLADHPGTPFAHSDVSRYIRAKVQSFKHYEKEEQESISVKILEKSRGCFKWVVNVVEILEENKPEHAPQILERKFVGMVSMFEEIFTNLAREPSDHLALVQWFLVAEKPLTLRELIAAIQIQDGPFSKAFDLGDDENTVGTRIFMGEEALTILDGFVQLVHPSMVTYFRDGRTTEVLEAHFNAAQACVKYLGAKNLNCGPLKGEKKDQCREDYQDVVQHYPFLEYAAAFWFTHFVSAGPEYSQQLWDLVCSELDSYPNWALAVQIHQFWHQRPYTKGQSLVHMLTEFCSPVLSHENLDTIVLEILQSAKPDCFARFGHNSVDEAGHTALWCAVERKAVQIVRWLIEIDGLDCNRPDQDGSMTPALLAVKTGHVGMVDIFLENSKVDWKCKDKIGRTPLFWAVAKNHDIVMRQLLTKRQCRESLDDCCPEQPPLVHAARKAHHKVVEVLLNNDADLNGVDHDEQRTALSWAAGLGHKLVVEGLLAHWETIDFDSKDRKRHWTAFQWAAAHDRLEIMSAIFDKMLRKWGHQSRDKCTLLLRDAAEYGRLESLRLILERTDCDPGSSCGPDGRTVLSIAAEFGKVETVQALIENYDADVNAKDGDWKTPLMWASHRSQVEVVRLLLSCDDIDFSAEDSGGRQVRDWARIGGQPEIVDLIRYRQRQMASTDR